MFHQAPNSKFSNFECPNCHVDIPLSNQYLQKCSWIRKKGLKDDLRSLTEKWTLIERELGNMETLKHIHAISDYLEDVVNLFQGSLVGRYVTLEENATNTEPWYPEMQQHQHQSYHGSESSQQYPSSAAHAHHHHQQQQAYPQQQQFGAAWNQQQPPWNFPVPGNFPPMPNQYGAYGFDNPNAANFQAQGSFPGGNFPNNFNNYFEKKMKQQQNRPPTELIQINTVGFLPKPKEMSPQAPNIQQGVAASGNASVKRKRNRKRGGAMDKKLNEHDD